MAIKATWQFNNQNKKILGNFHRLWCLLFGPLYYLFKGMFLWTIISAFTFNGLFIGLPLFNRSIVTRHYHKKGWVQTDHKSSK